MDMSWIIIECMPSSSEHILCIKPSNCGCILWISMLKIHVKWPSWHHFYSLSRPTSTWDPGLSRGSESADTSRWLDMEKHGPGWVLSEVEFEYETAKTIALIDTLCYSPNITTFFIETNGCSIFTCYGEHYTNWFGSRDSHCQILCVAKHGPHKHTDGIKRTNMQNHLALNVSSAFFRTSIQHPSTSHRSYRSHTPMKL